jgi:hypothetical protein
MLSLPKLLALGGIIWGVFYLFRMIERNRNNAVKDATLNPNNDVGNGGPDDAPKDKPSSLDLEECKLCGAWVAGQPCDRDDCPYNAGG